MGYQKIAYHNDLHGVDVAQFMFLLIKDAQLDRIAELRYLDMVSCIIAATCHDYDHDGFNNAYHVNKMTMRALRYHDESVQENYHAAESISIMLKPEFNFLENVSKDDVKLFRKRLVGMILSTDMAKHMRSSKTGAKLKGSRMSWTMEGFSLTEQMRRRSLRLSSSCWRCVRILVMCHTRREISKSLGNGSTSCSRSFSTKVILRRLMDYRFHSCAIAKRQLYRSTNPAS